jgi:hypothetical protein
VLVCVPCKGIDLDLADNLRQVLLQIYPRFQIRFIVESAADPAYGVIQRLMADSPVACELFVAGACKDSGQKVHNLRRATAKLPEPDAGERQRGCGRLTEPSGLESHLGRRVGYHPRAV